MTKKNLKIAMAQLNYKLNDFEGNLARIRAAIEKTQDADLIVFSELCLSGYYPMDLVEEPDFLDKQNKALEEIRTLSRKTKAALVIGAATSNQTGIGKPLHNSLLFIQAGEIKLTYDKQLLPTYNIFDERRHFEPGENRAAVHEINGIRLGFIICEDGWNDDRADYAVNPVNTLAAAKVNLIISINASPSNVGKQRQRHELFHEVAKHRNLPIIYVNQVGANDQIVFDGGSFIVDPKYGVVYEIPLLEEAVHTVVFDGQIFSMDSPLTKPVNAYLSDNEFYYRQTILGLRDYLTKIGFSAVVVGSSGGIDSGLTLALAVDALGADRVHAITMPSHCSSTGSVKDSEKLCKNLGVKLFHHPIGPLFDLFCQSFARSLGTTPSGLTKENVQARIRGTVLMEYSNHFGNLLLSTGNKSEVSVGYATLYGDMNGGLNLIGDLYKTEVFALARYYNELHGKEIIPQVIIDKEPSAELSEGQKDTDALPPYPVLDEILKFYIEGVRLRDDEYRKAKEFVAGLRAKGEGEMVDKVLKMIAKSEFKRRQAPPIIRVRNRAFGNGRQIPISAKLM